MVTMAIVTRRQNPATKRGPVMELRISKQHPFINEDVRANEERGITCRQYREGKSMLAIQRGKGRVADAERGRTCGWRERKDLVLTMVLIEGVVSDCLDRERVDVVVYNRATRMQTANRNRKTTIKHSIGYSSGTRTGNHNHKMGHGHGASARKGLDHVGRRRQYNK